MQIPPPSTPTVPAPAPQPDPPAQNVDVVNGRNFTDAAHSKEISEAIANYVLKPGWNDGTPEQVCGNMARAKEVISNQLKQAAWQQELDKLKADANTALVKTTQFGTRQQDAENRAAYDKVWSKLSEHVEGGAQKYVGDFAAFLPNFATCMATRQISAKE